VTENTVYRWESGRTEIPEYAPKLLTLQANLRALEASMAATRAASAEGIDQLIRSAFRETRRSRGLTQAALALRAHVSRSWVTHFETHGDVPTDDSLASALAALNIDADSTLSGVPHIGKVLAQIDGQASRVLLALLVASNLINEPGIDTVPSTKRRKSRVGRQQGELFST
jgi:transcriptional regulator with XRE-family HTH domain